LRSKEYLHENQAACSEHARGAIVLAAPAAMVVANDGERRDVATGLVGDVRHATWGFHDVEHAVGDDGVFFVDAKLWDAANAAPPVLGSQLFNYAGAPNRLRVPAHYQLHVWAWKHSPKGMFVDWSPKVSCEQYTGETGAHGSGHRAEVGLPKRQRAIA
jgi:hypothetical protein